MATVKKMAGIRFDEDSAYLLKELSRRARLSQTAFVDALVRQRAVEEGLIPNIYATAVNAPNSPTSGRSDEQTEQTGGSESIVNTGD